MDKGAKTLVLRLNMLLLASTALGDMAGECDLVGFYLEIGCTPVFSADNSTKCPESFTCPDLHPDPTMCFYRGQSYSDRSAIPQQFIRNPCSQACRCRVSDTPQFDCAAIDCVETVDSEPAQQCIPTYELDSCCSTGNVCGKDAMLKLASCEVDGQTYREGQSFEPDNTRKTCICTDQWNGSVDNYEYCKDIDCGIEIHYQAKILQSCAPIFAGSMKTCPIAFQCPTNDTKVIRGLNVRNISAQCLFGNKTLSVGDEVITRDKCTKCSCEVPPFASCTKKYSCA